MNIPKVGDARKRASENAEKSVKLRIEHEISNAILKGENSCFISYYFFQEYPNFKTDLENLGYEVKQSTWDTLYCRDYIVRWSK